MSDKLKIGVFGSAVESIGSERVEKLSQALGQALARYKDEVIVVTGACKGVPYAVAYEAHKSGVEVWGYSSAFDLEGQKLREPSDDVTIYDHLEYVPRDYPYGHIDRARYKYRNVSSTASCDAGIIVSGRWGTLNEFTNLIDLQKLTGVLAGTGGVADELPKLTVQITKEGQGDILFEADPDALVDELVRQLKIKRENDVHKSESGGDISHNG